MATNNPSSWLVYGSSSGDKTPEGRFISEPTMEPEPADDETPIQTKPKGTSSAYAPRKVRSLLSRVRP